MYQVCARIKYTIQQCMEHITLSYTWWIRGMHQVCARMKYTIQQCMEQFISSYTWWICGRYRKPSVNLQTNLYNIWTLEDTVNCQWMPSGRENLINDECTKFVYPTFNWPFYEGFTYYGMECYCEVKIVPYWAKLCHSRPCYTNKYQGSKKSAITWWGLNKHKRNLGKIMLIYK